jgi:hypothetical protein
VIARRALLIGAEDYGEGFASLPAVQQDIRLLRRALEAAGYKVEVCAGDVITNAGKLDEAIRGFCSAGGPEDVHIVYFSGHGLLVDNVDWIIPAGTPRKAATVSSNQRVSTDLSRTVTESNTGLVLFIIDACRDEEDMPVTKGDAKWGDPSRVARPGEHRFVRFFGCAANQVCQVLSPIADEPPSSLFTKAFADSVLEGNCISLDDLLPQVQKRCTELLTINAYLQPQVPHLSYGELSVEKKAILQRPIFDPVGHAALSLVWQSFDPDKFHCLVVISETEHQSVPDWGLTELVQDALGGNTGQRIWESFSAACNHRKFVSGRKRALAEAFGSSAVSLASISIVDVFASSEALDKAVRAVVEADLVVFDVTGFEPGVMLLVGVRSACCRSVSICSHGAGWKEGKTLEIPFNLQDLSINSHTPRESQVGSDPVVERFVRRVETGFKQLAKHPRYLDLPAYEALRELGSNYDAWSTIDLKERILVLCSYAQEFFPKWQFVGSQIKKLLWEKKNYSPEIERIIDYGTSQLIWQSLYEQIRRTAACVVDWSGYSPSVFLELGVRLAVSEWGAVHIVDEKYQPGGEKAPKKLTQIEKMHRLLNPIVYQYKTTSSATFAKVAEALLQRNPPLDAEAAEYNRIHRVLLPVIGAIQEEHPSVAEDLKTRADALHHPQQARKAVPQILFHGNLAMKQNSERAALELRVAAWLYLEHRVGLPKVREDAAMRELYRSLGRAAADALYDLRDDKSIEFAGFIEQQLSHLE